MKKKVIKCYDKALSINPKDANSWVIKGNALKVLNKNKEAIKEKALKYKEKNSH